MPFLGELLALTGATCFAIANVTISLGAVRKKGDNGALLSVIVTAAVSLLVWLLVGAEGALDHAPQAVLLGLAWFTASGLLTTVFGRITLFRSIQDLGVVRASALKRLVPFFSAVLAFVILGEVITGVMLGGMVMIAFGFGMLISRSLKTSTVTLEGVASAGTLPARHGVGRFATHSVT
jgi:drug/metabolite transporter (DMT)-like permease